MRNDKRQKRPRLRFIFLLLVAVIVAVSSLLYARPLPALYPTTTYVATATSAPAKLSWPATGEAAVGAVGYGVLASSGTQTPKPTASVAKVITALAVLKQHPLKVGEQGPTLTLDATDVASYNQYTAEDGSVALVQAGEQISEYQALETMLLPSANNMADSLARWAYGSLPAYTTAANQLVKSWGLTNTTIGTDASGFDPSTVSTANDLLNVGLLAMQNPVLAQIVGQTQTTDPVAGILHSTNQLLGQDGVIGIKTGNTDQAGGVYVSATTETFGKQTITIVSAVIGATDLRTAFASTIPFLSSAKANFVNTTLAKAGTTVGTYTTPWGSKVQAVTQQDISPVTWKGTNPKLAITLNPASAPLAANQPVGSLSFTSSSTTSSTPVVLQQNLSSPPWWWRIIRHKF